MIEMVPLWHLSDELRRELHKNGEADTRGKEFECRDGGVSGGC